jgi:hypothetical protein
MPAKAGIQNYLKYWIPAFAGMTLNEDSRLFYEIIYFEFVSDFVLNEIIILTHSAGFKKISYDLSAILRVLS